MKTKYIFLFILITTLLAIACLKTPSKKEELTHLFFTQYIQLKNDEKPLNLSLSNTNIHTKNNQPQILEQPNLSNKKNFFLFTGCATSDQKPDSLSKKLKKEPIKNNQNPTTSLFQKVGCGLIQTIIPLSF